MIDPSDYRKADDGMGLTISYDEEMTEHLRGIAAAEIRKQRQYLAPGTDTVAYHLSDVNACLRKAYLRRNEMQQQLDETGNIEHEDMKGLEAIFGRGYALQNFFLGDQYKEEVVWNSTHRILYSPDGGRQTPIEFKTTLSGPLVKSDREDGLSIEDILLYGNTASRRQTYYTQAVLDWQTYMLQVMYLEGWDHYYLSVVYLNGGDWPTFKITATPERLAEHWERTAADRIAILKQEDVMPGVEWRRDDAECTECKFFNFCMPELGKIE